MSDSFADLWNISAPLPSKQKPQTLSAAAATAPSPLSSQIQRTTSKKADAFSFLAASSSSSSISNINTANSGTLSRPITPSLLRSHQGTPVSSQSTKKDDRDAFADLFAGSTTTTSATTNSGLTLAARLAVEAQENSKRHQATTLGVQSHKSQDVSHEAWVGLDALEGGFSHVGTSHISANGHGIQGMQGKGLLDDDDDDDGVFGGGIVAAHQEDEEDILGVLSKPVEIVVAKKNSDFVSSTTSTTLSRPTPPPPALSSSTSTSTSGPPSPPPHILGQIVQMGFSVSQAKKALAATVDGKDVQGALETLLSGSNDGTIDGGDFESSPRIRPTQSVQARPAPPPPPHRPNVRGPPKGQKERERERKEREYQRARREDTGSGSGPTTAADIQEQADKLLLQASEIGMSVLSRASAFWKEGKEKVVNMRATAGGGGGFEERGRDGKSHGGGRLGGRAGGAMDGRPKWMKEVVDGDDDEFVEGHGRGFKDAVSPGVQDHAEATGAIGELTEETEVDLFSSDPVPPRPSVSVSQRASSSQRSSPPSQRPLPSQRPSKSSSRTHSHQTHSPPSRPRTLPTTTPSTLSLVSTHKNTGTSQFKLGQYGPASESYTSAITLLPPGHLLLVPLYTNRSLARLRCGEYVGAGEDAGEALKIICVSDRTDNTKSSSGNGSVIWKPDTEPPELIQAGKEKSNDGGWSDSQGVGIDLVDGYAKALRRRAEAWEGREKWVEAGRDWEVLAGGGWIGEGVRKEAVRGAGRCRKMVSASGRQDAGSSSSSALNPPLPKPKPRSKPSPPSFASSQPSKALLAHQATTLQAEADDTLKHQLKDSVDARISAWKNGKETNIRALLASLDMVLWDEILLKGGGGVKVNGLGELVTDGQVKKGYVKAIAKVHPDKLNSSNSTVEQRMLANSVFAVLNEAWIAFQGGK